MLGDITNREKQLLLFIRQLGWGEVKIRVENGQPVVIYEAIRTFKLDDEKPPLTNRNGNRKKNP
ncbi:transketolase [Desulforudis sp. 1088]|jgi:hypothetical protein|uniref:transketolase n=1 Tax=unclassified Candidatus Desulforudis TaxID=2635950 RepID=UPI0034911E4F